MYCITMCFKFIFFMQYQKNSFKNIRNKAERLNIRSTILQMWNGAYLQSLFACTFVLKIQPKVG